MGWLKDQKVEVEIDKIRFRYNTSDTIQINRIGYPLISLYFFFVFLFLFDFLIRLDMTF